VALTVPVDQPLAVRISQAADDFAPQSNVDGLRRHEPVERLEEDAAVDAVRVATGFEVRIPRADQRSAREVPRVELFQRGGVCSHFVEHAEASQYFLTGTLEEYAGADRAGVGGLFDEGHPVTVAGEKVRGGGTGDASPDDGNTIRTRHGRLLVRWTRVPQVTK
jgi:hypothetical protein